MSKLNSILAVLMSAGSMLASAGSVHALQAPSIDGGAMLEGPVSPRTLSRLEAGGRASVVVILDVPVDEMIAAAEDDPEGDYLRARIEQTRNAVIDRAFPQSILARRSGQPPAPGYEAFSFTPGFVVQASAAEIEAMRRAPGVAGVYENTRYRPMTDSSVSQVGARTLWDIGVTGAGVSVAVLDTGVEKDHPMVGPAITASACFNTTTPGESSSLCPNGADLQVSMSSADAGDACVEDNFDSVNGISGCFHGTHVASTAAGRIINLTSGRQLSGVARAADIIAVNVFSRFEPAECVDEGETPDGPCVLSSFSDQIEALDWLYLNRATLNLASVNMSLGGSTANATPCTSSGYDRTMGALTQQGVAVVVAAGNDGFANGLSSPACIASAISVGAVDDSDVVAQFSNDADYLDLLAPGVEILAAFGSEQITPGAECQNGATANSQGWCHYFSNSNGTSMATPHVAGAFAQLRQAFPNASVADMLNALKVTGEPVMDGFTQRVHARIQVDAAHTFLNTGAGVVQSVSLDSLTRYDARNTSSDVSSFNTSTRLIQNTSGQSRTIRVVSKPTWLTTEFFSGSGAPSGDPVSETQLTLGANGQLRLSVNGLGLSDGFNPGELVLSVDGSSNRIRLKVSALLTTPLATNEQTVRFGPFEWVNDANQSVGSIFRIVGLNSGAPAAISADIERFGAQDGQAVTNASIRCDFTVRANRYSGNEYVIAAADFADCPRFGQGDMFIDVRVNAADAATVRMRRFLFSNTGTITDTAFDANDGRAVTTAQERRSAASGRSEISAARASGLSDAEADQAQAVSQTTFGPFEWTYDASGELRSDFRLSPILPSDSFTIDVAVANASAPGYSGAFSDCRIAVRAARRGDTDYRILAEDLADCGAFGRADLTFQITADSSRINDASGDIRNMRMQRLIRRENGALTDLHLDAAQSQGVTPVAIGGGLSQVVIGPFEWAGDSTSTTSNQFRLTGVSNGAISRIDLSIDNATASGYNGDFNDCTLTIRPERAGANDYLIPREDLADCGAYRRGDITFRIQAPSIAMASQVKIRRLGLGGRGDVTDFGFDALGGASASPTAIGGGKEEIVFGPFEWVGDANALTQSVFRITGIIGGLPDSIEVSLGNATANAGGYTGAFSDCLMTLRPERAGANEFVITSADLVDCGSFRRADLSFRIRADAAVLDDAMRMRRFAITTTGGLTDFGFDNE